MVDQLQRSKVTRKSVGTKVCPSSTLSELRLNAWAAYQQKKTVWLENSFPLWMKKLGAVDPVMKIVLIKYFEKHLKCNLLCTIVWKEVINFAFEWEWELNVDPYM